MRSGPVILVNIVEEGGIAVSVGLVGAAVGPLSGEGLDEAFGFAVGLGAVGSGAFVSDAECAA